MAKSTTNTRLNYDEMIANVMDTINAEYGTNDELAVAPLTGMGGGKHRWPEDKMVRTGIISLDMAIGIGGLPLGRVIEIAGFESSGKTTVSLHVVRELQKRGEPVVYIDAENALDPNYMESIGVDTSRLLVHQPTDLESAINLMDKVMDMFHEAGYKGGIVVDSIAFLKSKVVMEADAGEEVRRAPEASRWATSLPKIVLKARQTGCCVIMINQLRESMSTKPWDQKPTSPGGSALRYAHSVKIHLRGKKVLNDDRSGIGYQEVTAKIEKNKVGSPAKTAVFYLQPGGGVDWYEDIYIEAQRVGIVEEGVKITWNGAEKKANWFSIRLSKQDIENLIEDNPEWDPDQNFLSVYRSGPFLEEWSKYPTFVEGIEERILASLDGIDPLAIDEDEETASDSLDVESDEDEEDDNDEE